jgi:hypothetical protein
MIEYIYTVYDSFGRVLASGVAPNMTTLHGEEVFLEALWRGKPILRFAIGLTNALLTRTSTLEGARQGEPPTAYGYSRKVLYRNTTDFPTLENVLVGGETHKQVRSKQVTFMNTAPEGGSNWPMVDKFFLVATLSESPLVERLVSFAPITGQPIVLTPQSTITVEARPLYGDIKE